MADWIERFIDRGCERHLPDAARDIAAGILKVAHLFNQTRLAGALGGFEQRIRMIEQTDDDLKPVAFDAAQFFHLKAQAGFFPVICFFQEFGERGGFGDHFVGDFPGGGDGARGIFLDQLPLSGGGADLDGEEFQVPDLFDG